MTVVSLGRVVLLFGLAFVFFFWLNVNFLLLFSPRVAVHCCHCEWSVWCEQIFLCALIFLKIDFEED